MASYSIKWQEHVVIVAKMKEFWEIDYLTDATICFKGKVFKGHKIVLAAASPYFAKLFSSKFRKNPYMMTNQDLSVDEFEVLLQFIYSGKHKN